MKDGKPTGGYDRLKIKYAESEATIEKQCKQINDLTKEVNNARSDAQEYKRQRDKAVEHMGWLRRFWYGFSLPEFKENEHWRD